MARKLVGGVKAFFSKEIQEKLEEVKKRNLIEWDTDAIAYCIDMCWFYQIGQYGADMGEVKNE